MFPGRFLHGHPLLLRRASRRVLGELCRYKSGDQGAFPLSREVVEDVESSTNSSNVLESS